MDTEERLEAAARKVLDEMLVPLGYEFEVTVNRNEEGPELMISTADAKYLIGENGDRLDDLQYLVNRLVQAEWPDAPRVRVDFEHYRAQAEARLLRRARSRAEHVLRTGRSLQMEPLNAYQRRLVHNELAKMEGIATASEETDSRFKRITISRKGE